MQPVSDGWFSRARLLRRAVWIALVLLAASVLALWPSGNEGDRHGFDVLVRPAEGEPFVLTLDLEQSDDELESALAAALRRAWDQGGPVRLDIRRLADADLSRSLETNAQLQDRRTPGVYLPAYRVMDVSGGFVLQRGLAGDWSSATSTPATLRQLARHVLADVRSTADPVE